MKSIKTALLIPSFIFILLGILPAQEVVVVYSGQTHSMLYPCSCPIRQDGGISRRATLIKELRKQHPDLLFLDCGNFTAGGQMDEYSQNINLDMQRSQVNYKALELMHYDAVGVGPDEFNFGKDFFLKNAKKTNPAYLSANLDTDKVMPYLVKDCGGAKIAIIGLTGIFVNQKTEGLKINQPELVSELIARLKTEGVQVVILLSTLGEKEDLKLISKVKGIDIIFVGYKPLKEEPLTKVDSTFMLRPAWQGRQLGKVILKIVDGKLTDCNLEELPLTDKIGDAEDISVILPLCFSDSNCKDKELTGICQNPGTLSATCSFIEPNKVNLTVISAKDCRTCNTEQALFRLKKKFPGLLVSNLDYPSAAAQAIIKDLVITTLPAFIFEKKVEEESDFDNIKDDLQLINNFYVLKPQASGLSYFLNRPPEIGNFDLFFSMFDKDVFLLLTTLKEFNPVLHFLAAEGDKGFEAKYGAAEVEESLRGVCVQKYHPERFWDYLICRSKNIHSSYWEDCLGRTNTLKVKNCARGQEGINLLRENTSLNKELQVFSGPSYLVNNQEIFSSRGVPAKEELKNILKKQGS
ncbi:MAG: hypothetical protein NT014_02870 [Candidatus Omnitrophica bacterium]|nr:hypothetical protein [Candidatus Omnitrophota bacterium]